MSESTKLFDLAKNELAKSADQKAIDALVERVEENKNSFDNALFQAKKAAKAAEKHLASLSSNPSATARQIIDAQDAVKVANAEVSQIEAIMAVRF